MGQAMRNGAHENWCTLFLGFILTRAKVQKNMLIIKLLSIT